MTERNDVGTRGARGNYMTQDTPLYAGDYLVSNNQRYFAILQDDGNFCVYQGSGPGSPGFGTCWAADGILGFAGSMLWLQKEDGNLVIYPPSVDGGAVEATWANGVQAGAGEYYAVMQDDGFFCEYPGPPPLNGAYNMGVDGTCWHTDIKTGGSPRLWPGSATATNLPPYDGFQLPWRKIILAGLGKVPEVGGMLEMIGGLLWSEGSAWSQVEDKVYAAIEETVGALIKDMLASAKAGLQTVYNNYTAALGNYNKTPTAELRAELVSQFTTTRNIFDSTMPTFMGASYVVTGLPVMATMATLHLALYRDALVSGKEWGLSDDLLADIGDSLRRGKQEPPSTLTDGLLYTYCDWVDRATVAGLPALKSELFDGVDKWMLPSWVDRNRYIRFIVLNVLDIRAFWPYVDPAVCPPGTKPPRLTREIFADPVGMGPVTWTNLFTTKGSLAPPDFPLPAMPAWNASTTPPQPAAPKRITHLRFDNVVNLSGVTVTYDNGAADPRQGTVFVGTTGGWDGDISAENPVVSITITNDSYWANYDYPRESVGFGILTTVSMVFKDGTGTGPLGNVANMGGMATAVFPGHVLTSIQFTADGEWASGAVFGFRPDDSWDD